MIDGLDCSCEFRWRPVFAEDVDKERVVGRVIRFDQVHEADIRGKVVIVSRVEQGFQREEPVSTAYLRCPTKLESRAMFV